MHEIGEKKLIKGEELMIRERLTSGDCKIVGTFCKSH